MNMSMDKPIALNRALEVPNLKTQKSMKTDASKAWELEYEHVHGQTDTAKSR